MTIVSHRHRFIFVRTRKTASTSIEIELSRHVGPDDVVTSFCARDERLRREAGGRGPQNHLTGSVAGRADPTPPGPQPGVKYYNHMSATQIRELVGTATWDTYFTFCFERNPWDKVVSLYYHRHRHRRRLPFADFVRSGEAADAFNFPLYHDGSRPLVEHIARFEDLPAELESIFRRIGLPAPLRLPRAKTQFRPGGNHTLFDEWSAARVVEMFRPEFLFHGYHMTPWFKTTEK